MIKNLIITLDDQELFLPIIYYTAREKGFLRFNAIQPAYILRKHVLMRLEFRKYENYIV